MSNKSNKKHNFKAGRKHKPQKFNKQNKRDTANTQDQSVLGALRTQALAAKNDVLNPSLDTPESDERVRVLVQEVRSLRNRLHQCNTRTEVMISQVRSAFGDRPVVIDIPKPPPRDRHEKRVEIPVLCLGDWHFGYLYPHGEHSFNYKIGHDRAMLAIDKFIATTDDRRNSAKIEELRLYLIGDMIEGESMRAGHSHSIEAPVITQAMEWAPKTLTTAIVKLMGSFRKIKIVAVPGNHGRNGPPRTDAHPATNWDRVCYETTRLMINNAIATAKLSPGTTCCEIEWDLPSDRYAKADGDDWFAIDYVFDWCNCLIHGEDLRGKSFGGIPFYGIEKMIRRYADIVSDPIDYMYMGHIHVDASIPANFREIFVNGAIESSSTFVRKELMSGSPPSQSAVFYSEHYGPISRHKFYLSDHVSSGQRTIQALAKQKERLKAGLKAAK